MKIFGIARKTATILANLSLFLNTFLPFVIATSPVYAEEPEGAVPTIIEASPTQEPQPQTDPTPTETVTPTITETPAVTPTETPVTTPTETITPTTEPTETPVVTPTETVTPTITETPTATPTAEVSPAENNNSQDSNQSSDNSAQNNSPSETPTETPAPEKPVDPVIKEVCLTANETITDSLAIDWNYDQEKDIYETKEKVKLGVKYIFPQENNVTVTFKCLPTNESLLSTLKIKRVKTSDLNLPQDTSNIDEFAYDVTTDMTDGIFKYDITLPKTSDTQAGIAYIEKSLDDAKQNVSAEEIKSVFEPEQQTNTVVGKDINHFTIYLVYMYDSNGNVVVNPNEPNSSHKITICHADGQSGNFSKLTVDDDSIIKNSGHDDHDNDIIPKFDYQLCPTSSSDYTSNNSSKPCRKWMGSYYKYADYKTYTYPSKNWDEDGQQILNNNCQIPQVSYFVDTYDSGSYSSPKDAFITGETVYGRGTRNLSANIRLRYLNPSNSVAYTCGYVNSNSVNCDYALPSNAPTGNWKIQLGRCDHSCNDINNWAWTGYAEANFTVSTPKGTIIAHNFTDNNNDGNEDAGETATAYWRMRLYSGSNCSGTQLDSGLISLPDGNKVFANLTPGSYSVSEDLINSTWVFTTPTCQNVTLGGGKTEQVNFGNFTPSSIKVIKQSNPEDTQNFIFTLKNSTNQTIGNAELDDDNSGSRPNNYTFNNLTAGTYTLSENEVTGWYLDSISCTGVSNSSVRKYISEGKVEIDVAAGQNPICTFNNYKYGSINVCKIIFNENGTPVDGSEVNGTNFTINWDNDLSPTVFTAGHTLNARILKSTPKNKKDAYCVPMNNLKITNYRYSQEVISDSSVWQTPKYNDQYESDIDDTGDFYRYGSNTDSNGEINLALDPPGINRTLVILNQYKFGSISGYKWEDINGNDDRDKDCHQRDFRHDDKCHDNDHCEFTEPTISGWTINLYQGDNLIKTVTTDEHGNYRFDKLTPGHYRVCEDERRSEGWHNTNQEGVCRDITISAGEDEKDINFGNQKSDPKLNISKSNNTGGSELSPGNSVEYKITLGVTDNSVNNLKVTDLLSDGFKYQISSYRVYLDGVLKNIPEPQYHSPGVWDLSSLGEIKPGQKIELIYTADISNDQQAGKYADLAYASAVYSYDSEKSLLAAATDEGYIDTNHVGTDVTVNRNSQNSISAGVEKTETINGQVLGASTEMPATGAATLWLIISSILGFFGLILIKHDKITKSMAKKIFSIFVLPLFLFLISGQIVFAESSLSVRLEQPKTPTNIKDLHLKFVALDINGNAITAKCLKKGPIDSGFSQYGSDIVLSAGGNASQCNTLSAIDRVGSYQFKVEANGVSSNTVNLDYKDIAPGTPTDYRKESLNGNCDFKIHFRTANDEGRTVKVELYRSTDSAFTANNDSLVHSVNIGSTQEADINNSVPDCSKTYYYVLRAFDNAGNGSDVIGDTVTVKTIYNQTSITGTPAQGAIPVAGSNIPGESDNDQNVTGDNQPETSNQDQSTGQILGTQVKIGNFITNHKIISGTIAVVILAIIIYAFKKIRQGKKSSRRK
jgi:hypothetical protein